MLVALAIQPGDISSILRARSSGFGVEDGGPGELRGYGGYGAVGGPGGTKPKRMQLRRALSRAWRSDWVRERYCCQTEGF